MKTIFSLFLLSILLISGGCCTNEMYTSARYMNFHLGVEHGARELSKGNFVMVTHSRSRFDGASEIAIIKGHKPKQLRYDISFQQYLTKKYGINYRVMNDASHDYVSGYTSVMTAALRERYGDDYYERARKEFYPDAPEGVFINPR